MTYRRGYARSFVIGLCALAISFQLLLHPSLAMSKSPDIATDWHSRNEKTFLRSLWSILESNGKVGRIYFHTTCSGRDGDYVGFPKIKVSPRNGNLTGLEAIRWLIKNNKDMYVAEDLRGIVRIKMKGVSESILKTRISTVEFDTVAQYNNLFALIAIEQAREVKSAREAAGFRIPNLVLDLPIVPPLEHLPHLPSVLSNITMDQALDEVALAFHGIVLYGECPAAKVYELSFDGGYGVASRNGF